MAYLSKPSEGSKLDHAALMARVIAQGGPGGYAQVWRLVMLRLRGTGIDVNEFYQFGFWRGAKTRKFRREFLPASRIKLVNKSLLIPSRGISNELLSDKLHTEGMFGAAGLPCVRTIACYGERPAAGSGAIHLTDAAQMRAFLADPDNLPVFGKPRADSLARGSVMIDHLTQDAGGVVLLNGKTAPLDELVTEIINDWGTGYLFQPFYRTHSALAAHVGPAMASVRIVTLRTGDASADGPGIEPLYAMIRVPVKGAMHDGDHAGSRAWALIDPATGVITRLRDARDATGPDLTHWLNPDAPLVGLRLPHWEQAMAAVIRAHALFEGHGILGWDVFLTEDGALLNEVNGSPRDVYQPTALRGLLNPDLKPIIDRAVAYAARVNGAGSKAAG